MTRDAQLDAFLRALSRLLGWVYTLSWSLSFYPQPWLNWQRRSTHGLAIDYPALNCLGFASYTISTACFLYSPVIRAQYAQRHPLSPEPTVRFNDLVFGAHAVVLVFLTYSQFYSSLWGFKVSDRQKASKPVLLIIIGSLTATLTLTVSVRFLHRWQWIDVLYLLSYVKLLATFVKYIPQAFVNFKRKSTKGWSIEQILFDIVGGCLSLIQLIIDASFQGDWSGVSGNPLKFGLACVSILFDVIFITQHFFLYPEAKQEQPPGPEDSPSEPLLGAQSVDQD